MQPCPVCKISYRRMPFIGYVLICEKCWVGIRGCEPAHIQQLQWRLTFMHAINRTIPMVTLS